jgi:glycosyltransferase involved in cell wall biosynthesis
MDAILSAYPLSADFTSRLDALTGGSAKRITVAELRLLSLPRMLRYLRGLRCDRLIIPEEDSNSGTLTPVLLILAKLTRAKQILTVGPGGATRRIGLGEVAAQAWGMALASLASRRAMSRAGREIRRLAAEPLVSLPRPANRSGLFLNANLWFGVKAGGSVGHISGVVNALDEEGLDMTFATAGGRMLVHPRIPIEELVAPAHFGTPWEYNYYRFHDAVVAQLHRLHRQRRFEFIYQRMSLANYSGVALSRALRIPLILEYNGSEAWVARNWGRPLHNQELAEEVEEICLRHAHQIVTISGVLRDELLERGIPPERIVTYPNCIDPDFINPDRFSEAATRDLRAQYGIADNAVVVTFLGTFGQWHGAEVLARAIRKLHDDDPQWFRQSKVHFLLVGDGLRMPEVKGALGHLANGTRVTLTGLVAQDRAPVHLAASDILASPHVSNADGSRFYGSPTNLFEDRAMARAIVASDLDQIGEILRGSDHIRDLTPERERPRDGAVALLARPGDVGELASAIRFLVDRPGWRHELGQRARALALSKYTWRHHVRAILDGAQTLGLVERRRLSPAAAEQGPTAKN